MTQALGPQYENTTISEVLQYGASRYIGSFDAHFLGVYYYYCNEFFIIIIIMAG